MKKNLWLIVLVLYISFIFANSLTPAHVSSKESGFVLMIARQALDMVGLGNVGITEHIIRKTAHFAEYAGMGILLFLCLNKYRLRGWERPLITGFLCLSVPFVDETLQLFTPGRSGQLSDVWLDLSGALFGTFLIWFLCHVIENRKGYAYGRRPRRVKK